MRMENERENKQIDYNEDLSEIMFPEPLYSFSELEEVDGGKPRHKTKRSKISSRFTLKA